MSIDDESIMRFNWSEKKLSVMVPSLVLQYSAVAMLPLYYRLILYTTIAEMPFNVKYFYASERLAFCEMQYPAAGQMFP